MAFTILFSICAVVSASIIAFWVRRHPNPRFRPRFGEVLLISIVAIFISVTVAYLGAGLFDLESKLKRADNLSGGRDSQPKASPDGQDEGQEQ